MSTLWKTTLAFMFLAGFGACSDIQFGKIANCQNSGYTCQVVCQDDGNCIEEFSNYLEVPKPQVDILFVIDNSGSMTPEHEDLEQSFHGFFDKIKGLDYRIAMTTTDVSASASALARDYNQPPYSSAPNKPEGGTIAMGGYYQDGKFLPFYINGARAPFLQKNHSGSDSANEQAFKKALGKIREGTKYCETSKLWQEYCASGDERGTYAMNLALERNEAGFFRPGVHLAIVVVSDEDVRSKGIISPGCDPNSQLDCLDEKDLPESVIDTLKRSYPAHGATTGKTLGVHSIVVDGTSCQNLQKRQIMIGGTPSAAGEIGTHYRRLSDLTKGHKGSVCASSYTAQLGQIGSTVKEQVSTMALACRPINDYVLVEFEEPVPHVQVIIEAAQQRVRFVPELPPGTRVQIYYDCHI